MFQVPRSMFHVLRFCYIAAGIPNYAFLAGRPTDDLSEVWTPLIQPIVLTIYQYNFYFGDGIQE